VPNDGYFSFFFAQPFFDRRLFCPFFFSSRIDFLPFPHLPSAPRVTTGPDGDRRLGTALDDVPQRATEHRDPAAETCATRHSVADERRSGWPSDRGATITRSRTVGTTARHERGRTRACASSHIGHARQAELQAGTSSLVEAAQWSTLKAHEIADRGRRMNSAGTVRSRAAIAPPERSDVRVRTRLRRRTTRKYVQAATSRRTSGRSERQGQETSEVWDTMGACDRRRVKCRYEYNHIQNVKQGLSRGMAGRC